MKVCPVCKAECFKDMELCFGCMHRFGEPDESDFEPVGDRGRKSASGVLAVSGTVSAASGGPRRDPGVSAEGDASALAKEADSPSDDGAQAPVGVEAVVLPVSGGAYNLVISFQPVQQPQS